MRLGYVVLALGAAAALGVGSWLAFHEAERPAGGGRPPYVLPVTLEPVVRRDVAPRVLLTGSVRADRRALLGFEVAGVISSLAVLEAQVVRRGDVLATLEDRDARLQEEQRKADLALARRELQKLDAGTRTEDKQRLAADKAVAEAEERLARLEVDRARGLLERQVISQADLERRQASYEAAKAKVAAMAAELSKAEAGTRIEDLEIARARVRQAEAALDVAQRELAKTRLVAPWDGVVLQRPLSAGDYARPGATVIELVDPERLVVEVDIPSRYAARLGERPQVQLSLEEVPGYERAAALDAQLPVADRASRNFQGLVRLGPDALLFAPEGRAAHVVLRPGMFVRIAVALAPLKQALVVPGDAVRTTQKGPVVVRARPAAPGQPPGTQAAEWVPVRVIGSDAQGTAVESAGPPLAPGDLVVVTGVDLAFPGAPLLPRQDPRPAAEAPAAPAKARP